MKIDEQTYYARLLMHTHDNWSVVEIEDEEDNAVAGGGVRMQIPKDAIPPYLRQVGSRFRFTMRTVWPDKDDSVDELRAAHREAVIVHELTND
ncbi:MAG: hypothetical protein QNJ06_02995 [Kiloniellales bacterium]|nr:hypothetical protein [Kiloniellales bacterium]MDJ0968842.1 hypothetical protein [Kiloniellales bacterium]MDJ0981906.1 hypothetical protein [Kiloniellales bacterium]